MASEKEVEPVIVGNYVEMDTEGKPKDIKSKLSNFLWHGGSVYDAWFSCASNQVGSVFFLSIYSFPCSVFVPFPCHVQQHVLLLVFSDIVHDVLSTHFRWLKFCLRCHTHFPNWECSLGYFFNSSMACWVVGQLTSLVFSMLNTEPGKREKRLISGTMSFRFISP